MPFWNAEAPPRGVAITLPPGTNQIGTDGMPFFSPEPRRVITCDLGKIEDYTAIMVLEEDRTEANEVLRSWINRPDEERGPVPHLPIPIVKIRLAERERGWPYPMVNDRLVRMKRNNALLASAQLIVDQTGVGVGVVDFMRRDGLNPFGITITAGTTVTPRKDEYAVNVPKKELASSIQALLSQRKLKMHRDLPHARTLREELLNFKVKISTAGNELMECLVAGTIVETRRGPTPIECVNRDDDVLTRNGYNRVVWSGETRRVRETCRVRLDSGSVLEGTPDHLVYTLTRGWVPLVDLTCHDLLVPKPSSSTDTSTAARRSRSTSFATNFSTGPSGNITTARSRRATASTTRTRTRETTTSTIWSRLPTAITAACISGTSLKRSVLAQGAARRSWPAAAARSTPRIRGTCIAPRPARTGADHLDRFVASSAGPSLRATATDGTGRPYGFVPGLAATPGGIAIASTRPLRARSVGRRFRSKASGIGTVRVAAPPVIVYSDKPRPVYDLIVDRHREFFANGVLVHNSWRDRDHDDMVLSVGIGCWYLLQGGWAHDPSYWAAKSAQAQAETIRRKRSFLWPGASTRKDPGDTKPPPVPSFLTPGAAPTGSEGGG